MYSVCTHVCVSLPSQAGGIQEREGRREKTEGEEGKRWKERKRKIGRCTFAVTPSLLKSTCLFIHVQYASKHMMYIHVAVNVHEHM